MIGPRSALTQLRSLFRLFFYFLFLICYKRYHWPSPVHPSFLLIESSHPFPFNHQIHPPIHPLLHRHSALRVHLSTPHSWATVIITSHHIISHIISYHIISHHITFYSILSHHNISPHPDGVYWRSCRCTGRCRGGCGGRGGGWSGQTQTGYSLR